ncbi:heme/hemin ABC transporter substrate-binding protein [Burkholderia pseudomallei]|uniref:heme/hemin ABC transporter substrate-binding protein n=1 Tax=Burkholderia pseudomallei TaxID=28450 RepID=UPI0005E77C89|nr:helical backbone metal receptor [Burkholderia pseudomallei]ALC59158.1 hemin ABC transporter substrate-binding protein [Burkholderia pseudomallei]MBD2980285.1 ABC transporter substrate-binding protein [Burkholderia pseudomallei]MBD3016317.1 ABC transporter substrate-binding protein [Burkholderia pseudomallei]MBF3386762.1 ABC transporter substrate-binding protein [Burkholderia pseudomallei]MBF3422879.1 ABC transporter substrate-binding protein [Burkholderia pseudomallei]
MSKPARIDARRRAWLAGTGALVFAAAHPGAFARAPASAPPKRVVAIGGALAETIYALGGARTARYELVGTDTTCTYPEAARRLPKVGYQRALSTEGLLSLRPDVVLASAEAGPAAALSQLARAGVAVTTFDEAHDVESVRRKIRGIANALSLQATGDMLLARFDRDWLAARAAADAAPPRGRERTPARVLFVLNHTGNQALVAGQQTAADAMIRYAGAHNAMQGFDRYKPLTAEALVAAAPDVVLITDEGLQAVGGRDALLAAPGFGATPAGRARRVVSLDALFLLGFGPRLPQAVTALQRRLNSVLA